MHKRDEMHKECRNTMSGHIGSLENHWCINYTDWVCHGRNVSLLICWQGAGQSSCISSIVTIVLVRLGRFRRFRFRCRLRVIKRGMINVLLRHGCEIQLAR